MDDTSNYNHPFLELDAAWLKDLFHKSNSVQVSVIEGTFLALEHMSLNKGGRGGVVVNVASFGGTYVGGHLPSQKSTSCMRCEAYCTVHDFGN